jgi:D-alanyl-D-alanine-carboxypeptidase/D-alanyl-D-alanine-endopeptidase
LGKTGGGAGFETYIALSPARQTGIFLAVTDGKGHPQGNFFEEGNNLLAALANVPPIPQKVRLVRVARRKPAAHRRSKTPLVAAAPSSAHRRSTTARAAAAPSPAHRRHRRG